MKLLVFVPVLMMFLVSGDLAIAQSVGPGGFVPCDGYNCSACDLVSMANTIIVWLFGIIFLIFAGLMAVAGFGLVTSGGNQSALEAAKSKFKNGIIGILIVMSAWLLVDTLMKALVGGGSTGAPMGEIAGWGPWAQVKCSVQTSPVQWARTGQDNPGSAITPPTGSPSPTSAHAAAVATLGPNFTISSSGNCSDRTKRNCTSLDGIRALTLTRIKEFQTLVGEPVTITGGTEVGHADIPYSHANGYKIDLRIQPAVNNYITSNFTPVPGSNNKWKDSRGNVYYRHGPPDHWDITITN